MSLIDSEKVSVKGNFRLLSFLTLSGPFMISVDHFLGLPGGGGEAGQRETVAEIADARGLCPRIASRERQPPLPGLGLTAGQDQAPQPFGLIWLYTEARACLGTSKNSCYLCRVAEPEPLEPKLF